MAKRHVIDLTSDGEDHLDLPSDSGIQLSDDDQPKHVKKAPRRRRVTVIESDSEDEGSDSEDEVSDSAFEQSPAASISTGSKSSLESESTNTIDELTEMRLFTDDLTMDLVCLEAPDWYMNPNFKLVLEPESTAIFAATPLTFAPGLLDVVQSSSPPRLSYFKTTPAPARGYWAVYVGTLEKPGCKPKLCIGSGTNAVEGVVNRTRHYLDEKHPSLPRYVRRAFDQGYELTHMGMLCWTPLPPAGIVPRARLRMYGAEAAFTHLFFSAHRFKVDVLWEDLMPWSREDVEWEPLNSHTPLNEGISGDLKMTPEQLLAADTGRRERYKIVSRAAAKRSTERQKERDIKAWRLMKRTQNRTWRARNKQKSQSRDARRHQKVIDLRLHECKTCNLAVKSISALNKHYETANHKLKVAVANGAPKPVLSENAALTRAIVARNKANKTYFCKPCDKPFASPSALASHKTSKRHHKVVKLAKKAAGKESTGSNPDDESST